MSKSNAINTRLDVMTSEDFDTYRRNAPDVMNTTGAARFLGLTERVLVENIERLDIPHRAVGKTLIFSKDALVDWVNEAR